MCPCHRGTSCGGMFWHPSLDQYGDPLVDYSEMDLGSLLRMVLEPGISVKEVENAVLKVLSPVCFETETHHRTPHGCSASSSPREPPAASL